MFRSLLAGAAALLAASSAHAQFAHPVTEGVDPRVAPDLVGYWIGPSTLATIGSAAANVVTLATTPLGDDPVVTRVAATCLPIGDFTYCSEEQPDGLYGLFRLERAASGRLQRMDVYIGEDATDPRLAIETSSGELSVDPVYRVNASAELLRQLLADHVAGLYEQPGREYWSATESWARAEVRSWTDADATTCDELAGTLIDPLARRYGSEIGDTREGALAACERAAHSLPEHPRYRYLFGRALADARRSADAVTELVASSSLGYPAAFHEIGARSFDGTVITQNFANAYAYMERAAAAGVNVAHMILGHSYHDGIGGTVDERKAFGHYLAARAGGDERAAGYLGDAYLAGEGVEQNTDAALDAYLDAYEHTGSVRAVLVAGLIQLREKHDAAAGLANLRLAADAGASGAALAIGTYYYEQRSYEAVEWLEQAHRAGWAEASHLLGAMYLYGRGVSKDLPTALGWLEEASNRGVLEADYLLGSTYAIGEDVAADYARADYYLRRASGSSDDKIRSISLDWLADRDREAAQPATQPAESSTMSAGEFALGLGAAVTATVILGKILFGDTQEEDGEPEEGSDSPTSSGSSNQAAALELEKQRERFDCEVVRKGVYNDIGRTCFDAAR